MKHKETHLLSAQEYRHFIGGPHAIAQLVERELVKRIEMRYGTGWIAMTKTIKHPSIETGVPPREIIIEVEMQYPDVPEELNPPGVTIWSRQR